MKKTVLVLAFILMSVVSFAIDFKCDTYSMDDFQFVCVTPRQSTPHGTLWNVITYNKISRQVISERYVLDDNAELPTSYTLFIIDKAPGGRQSTVLEHEDFDNIVVYINGKKAYPYTNK